MKNIFITGISGYLGTVLGKKLSQRDDVDKIVGIDINPPADELKKKIRFYQKDIRNPEIQKLLIEHKIDTVFHLAFVVKPIHNLKQMHDIDANGTNNILTQSYAAGVSHLIAIRSTLAYGAHADNPEMLRENSPLRGNKTYPYGYYKAITDRMIQDFAGSHRELSTTILRPCTVFGPSIDNYVSRMLFLPITASIKGYDPEIQFVHEKDFVNACLTAFEKKLPGIFNIAGDGTLAVSEIARMLGSKVFSLAPWIIYPVLECLWKLHFPMIEVNRGYLDYIRYPFVASNKKAKQELNFYPDYSSIETLNDTITARQLKNK